LVAKQLQRAFCREFDGYHYLPLPLPLPLLPLTQPLLDSEAVEASEAVLFLFKQNVFVEAW
jgi:hypothetical protein